MSKNGILFDLDGTLWDSCVAIMPSWQKVMKAHGIKRPPITQEEMNSYMGKTVEQIAPLMLPEVSLEEAINIMKEGCIEELQDLRKNGATLYDGIIETLRELSKTYNLFIVSNCQDGYIQAFIEHYNLSDVIKDFECAGRTGKCKGDNIRLVVERNNITKAFYVGDTILDKEAATKASLPFVLASYGFGEVENPDYKITTPKDLLKIAERFFS
ncbi:MAG: HAD family hydrolase [Clostridia bacterium]|nr:HAD family hydrolase [Clostridia bacterium]